MIDRIPGGRKVSIERETFPALVADRTLYAIDSPTCTGSTPAPRPTYLEVNLDLLDGKRDAPETGIDAPTSIASTAKVLRSVIGSGVTIGADAEVVDSVVMQRHPNRCRAAVVRDSIVGRGGHDRGRCFGSPRCASSATANPSSPERRSKVLGCPHPPARVSR